MRSNSYTISVCNNWKKKCKCTSKHKNRVNHQGNMKEENLKNFSRQKECWTCKTFGKFSLCASCVAIVDFPTQAVPQTRITKGTLWWWNLKVRNKKNSISKMKQHLEVPYLLLLSNFNSRASNDSMKNVPCIIKTKASPTLLVSLWSCN